MQNLTANTRIVVILTKNGNNTYTNFDGLTPNNEGFVTHYINVGGSANWNGTVNEVNFRFKQGGGVNNNVYFENIGSFLSSSSAQFNLPPKSALIISRHAA